jgi:hypothetical protein
VVANEWLRILVGPIIGEALYPANTRVTRYDNNLKPSIFNEISTACHRY